MFSVTLTQLGLLVLTALLLAVGQILFKYGAISAPKAQDGQGILFLLLQPSILVALVFYGVSTILWVNLLQTTPLSIAYPFMALGFIIVPLAGHYLFNEVLDLRYLGGLTLIISGLFVLNYKG